MDKGFLEASVTGSAVVSGPLELPVLRPLLDKHHFGTIDCIRLYIEISSKSANHIYA
jgi:hypothetical protein